MAGSLNVEKRDANGGHTLSSVRVGGLFSTLGSTGFSMRPNEEQIWMRHVREVVSHLLLLPASIVS